MDADEQRFDETSVLYLIFFKEAWWVTKAWRSLAFKICNIIVFRFFFGEILKTWLLLNITTADQSVSLGPHSEVCVRVKTGWEPPKHTIHSYSRSPTAVCVLTSFPCSRQISEIHTVCYWKKDSGRWSSSMYLHRRDSSSPQGMCGRCEACICLWVSVALIIFGLFLCLLSQKDLTTKSSALLYACELP